MSKKAVVFDFDGTLADSLPVLIDSYNAVAPRYRLKKVNITQLDEFRKLSYGEIFRRVNMRAWKLPFVIRSATRQLRRREHELQLFDGIVDLLNELVESGHRVGILTSNHSDVVTAVLADHKVAQLDFIVSQRSLFAKHKAFRKIERVHSLKPEDIVYVGDESRDVTACRKAGVEVIGVTWGLGGKETFEKVSPDVVVDTVASLKKTIKNYLR